MSDYTTKKQAIRQIAIALIKHKGSTNTCEILAACQEIYPQEKWIHSTISSAMSEMKSYFKPNYGSKYIIYTFYETTSREEVNLEKIYFIKIDNDTVQGSREVLTKICIAMNLPYRFSESHNEFQDFTKIPFTHLVNIVAKDMEGLSRDELKAYMNTSLFKYYATKV